MHALVVVSHPVKDSFTHAIAAELTRGVTDSGRQHSFEIADLAAEGFDPRQTAKDLEVFHRQATLPHDIAAEQARIDKADALVLVFPVYWWSFPALLKGWIDRVFTIDWAYGGKTSEQLAKLTVHLIGIGDSDSGTYTRHGYFDAIKTQIDHGIFDYCGIQVARSEIFHTSESDFPEGYLARAREIGQSLFKDS